MSSPPLGPGETDHGLFIIEGDRRQEVDPDRWEAAVADRLATGGAADLAPSVILRALLQDHLLRPAAQVVGRGEAAYLQQLQPMYDGLEVAPPARIPRLHATIIPRGLLSLEGVEEAIQDPESRVAMLAAARVPGNLEQRLTSTRQDSRERLREILEEASGFARDLQDLGDSAARKIDQQYGRIADVLARRGRQSLYAEDARYRHLAEFLRPRRGEQDRGLSGLSAELMLGSRASRHLLGLAEAHLDRLAEAQMHHFVLEAHHG